jgi:multidrug efflux pump subunit AcrA (membrane-fusion protein)
LGVPETLNKRQDQVRFLTSKELKESRAFFEMSLPKPIYWFLYGIIILLVGASLWLFIGSMEIIVKAPAMLKASNSTSELVSEVSGHLVEKNFVHGERVNKGQLLWALDRTELNVALSAAFSEEKRIKQEIENTKRISEIIDGIQYDQASPEVQRLARLIELEKIRLRIITEQTRRDWQNELALPEGSRTRQLIIELEEAYQIAKTLEEKYVLQERQNLYENIQNLERKLEVVNQTLASLHKQISASEVKAPMDGYIEEVSRLNVGDLVQSGSTILRIFPIDPGEIRADIFVLSNEIAQLKTGMEYRLLFPGYSPSEYGYLKGKILTVPQDARQNQDIEPVFQLEGSLERDWLNNTRGERIQLQSGMQANVSIIVNRKPVWFFLLQELNFIN